VNRRRPGSAAWLVALLALAACARPGRAPSSPPPPTAPAPRLTLDLDVAPVAFRELADDALLIDASTGPRRLADFGNYLDRMAKAVPSARFDVWDDEEAWRRSRDGGGSKTADAHQRALFVKQPAPDPVERYVVFDAAGEVVYQRDFRSWPLGELDE
jgi:hypothetical protein